MPKTKWAKARRIPALTVQPTTAAVQPSISTVPCIILNQSLKTCYSSLVSADQKPRRPVLQNPLREVCVSNLFLLMRFRTLWGNGALATPLQSIASALFPVQRRGCLFITTHRPLHTPYKLFRINTCRNVSKQRTLSTFRINTYEKQEGRGTANSPALDSNSIKEESCRLELRFMSAL